jgi:phosphoribosylanthranilate isomerase
MKLKVCGMRYGENIIRLMEEINPEFVGFIFYPGSPRYFLQKGNTIPSQVPPEKRTGVFVDASINEILGQAATFELRNIQLHGSESPELCSQLMDEGMKVIKAISIAKKEDLQLCSAYADACDYLLFDTKSKSFGGTGKKFNWEILRYNESDKPYFLSGGIDLDDIDQIFKLDKQPCVVDINSRFELSPGLKDISKISHFKTQLFHYE